MGRKFYIADLHFGHKNIIKFSKRKFKDVDEMDEIFIRRWNNKVDKDDDVYVLGDMIYKSKKPEKYLSRLNGNIHIIKGNHDMWLNSIDKNKYKNIKSINQYLEINDNGRRVVLFHYPIMDWNGKFRGTYHLHGHIHNNLSEALVFSRRTKNMFNVGIDIIGEPMTLDELISLNDKDDNENVQLGAIYKVKNKGLSPVDEYLSEYVRVLGFASNPLLKDEWFVEYLFVYKNDLEPVSRIHPEKVIDYKTFCDNFILDMDYKEVNDLIYKLNKK